MNTIQVRARHAMTHDVELDVNAVSTQTGPMSTWREITPESAVAIASWWQSSGRVGHALASFASGAPVDRNELLDDITATRRERMSEFDARALDCLSTFVINYGRED